MSESIIRFFKCQCWRILDQFDTETAIPCKCGNRMFRYANPTVWNTTIYFLTHPKMVKVFFMELLWK